MPRVKPFCGLLYAPPMAPAMAKLATEPYDKITPEMQRRYVQRHPNNFVHLILDPIGPRDDARDNRYTRAAKRLRQWIQKGVLRHDETPAFYLYEQTFGLRGAEVKARRGLIGLLRLEPFSTTGVLPHEKTLSKPRKDRLSLLRATRANLEQIFLLYDDAQNVLERRMKAWSRAKPLLDFKDDKGVRQRLWRVDETKDIALASRFLSGRKLFIADGHHRYTISLKHHQQLARRKGVSPMLRENSAWRMATFVNVHSPGLVILPTHRLIQTPPGWDSEAFLKALARDFDVRPLRPGPSAKATVRQILAGMKQASRRGLCIGLFARGIAALLVLRRAPASLRKPFRDLDVAVLHKLIVEKALGIKPKSVERGASIAYIRDPEELAGKVARGDFGLGLLLNPPAIRQVQRVASAGECMPQKSTDFYPKLLSGLVAYDMRHRRT